MKSNIPAAKQGPHKTARSTRSEASDEIARTIAEEFNDLDNLQSYQLYCSRYPESVVRTAFDNAVAVPPEQVKRSRLALFIFLLKKHAKKPE